MSHHKQHLTEQMPLLRNHRTISKRIRFKTIVQYQECTKKEREKGPEGAPLARTKGKCKEILLGNEQETRNKAATPSKRLKQV